eukprot:2627848-Rhodomonas_salina.3
MARKIRVGDSGLTFVGFADPGQSQRLVATYKLSDHLGAGSSIREENAPAVSAGHRMASASRDRGCDRSGART